MITSSVRVNRLKIQRVSVPTVNSTPAATIIGDVSKTERTIEEDELHYTVRYHR